MKYKNDFFLCEIVYSCYFHTLTHKHCHSLSQSSFTHLDCQLLEKGALKCMRVRMLLFNSCRFHTSLYAEVIHLIWFALNCKIMQYSFSFIKFDICVYIYFFFFWFPFIQNCLCVWDLQFICPSSCFSFYVFCFLHFIKINLVFFYVNLTGFFLCLVVSSFVIFYLMSDVVAAANETTNAYFYSHKLVTTFISELHGGGQCVPPTKYEWKRV